MDGWVPNRSVCTGTGVSPSAVNRLDHIGSKDSVTGAGLFFLALLFGGDDKVAARFACLLGDLALAAGLLLRRGDGVTLLLLLTCNGCPPLSEEDEGTAQGVLIPGSSALDDINAALPAAVVELGMRAAAAVTRVVAAFLRLRRSCGEAAK